MGETGYSRAKKLIAELKELNDFMPLDALRNEIRAKLSMNEKTITMYLHLMCDLRLITLKENAVELL